MGNGFSLLVQRPLLCQRGEMCASVYRAKIMESEMRKLLTLPCCATGDVKEFGFREITDERKDTDAIEAPLQPVPVPPPERMADASLAVTVCVSGLVSSAQVPSSYTYRTS